MTVGARSSPSNDARTLARRSHFRRIDLTVLPVTLRTSATRRRSTSYIRIPPAMPSCFEHSDSGVRTDHLPVIAHCTRANGNEGADVVVVGIHLGDFARSEPIDIRLE